MSLPLVYHPNYSCPFPENHRFVMSKFVRLHKVVEQKGYITNNLFQPDVASLDDLGRAHCLEYLNKLCGNQVDHKEWRRIGLPWSQGLVDRTLTAPNGTLETARLALKYGMASHLAGGTHHAHYDFGSGFCILNDLAYAAKTLVHQGEVEKVLIFDLDVHQGDGTASILEDEPRVFTCSIHCEKNFPFRKTQSDLDIGLDVGLSDQEYLDVVEQTLQKLLSEHTPDLVLYDAGVDVWEYDELGRLNISWAGIQQRDELVLKECLLRHIPVATVIGGGYDKDHQRLAERHSLIIQTAFDLFPLYLS
ncbi:histone deacetylase family protein [Litoribrevibacter albus]|uniref:Histone deacetylase n=1 Tax=Litoribrevibacter albus TaxID=1473156 RepID=A0AA37SBY4_9GAMM|nr:histone deacetylase [Litoribrevibacter albus]GLQ31716.1 histone deacetylase [Litoribrevibacter albus]